MKVKVVNAYDKFLELESEWNKLLVASGYDSVFLTHEWFSAFISGFRLDKKLYILLVYINNKLIGILPLYKEIVKYKIFRSNVLRSITNVHTPKYSFIVKKGFEYVLWDVIDLLKSKTNWDVIYIDFVSEKSSLNKSLTDKKSEKYSVKSVKTIQSPFVELENNWENYYNSLSKSFRKEIKNKENKSNRDFNVSFQCINGNNFNLNHLNLAFLIEDSGWKGRKGSSIFKNNDFKKFYETLAVLMNKKNWFDLLFLNYSGRKVAFQFNLKYKGTYSSIKIGFDEEFRRYSPGIILNVKAIEHACSNNNVYDMLGNINRVKMKFTKQNDQLTLIYIFNRKFKSKLLKFFMFDSIEFIEKTGLKEMIKKLFSKRR